MPPQYIAPTQGSVTVGGRSYRDLPAPTREVGALLDAKALHGGRRARDHLLCLAHSNGIPRSWVDEVLRIVGLEGVAKRRAKGLSLGMGQQLGIASALLGDPACAHLRRTCERPRPGGQFHGSGLLRKKLGRQRHRAGSPA